MSCRRCHKPGHNSRTCHRRYYPLPPRKPQVYRDPETAGLRQDLLGLIGRRPVPSGVLFARLRDGWGAVGERRLQRALRWLVERGAAVPIGAVVVGGNMCGCEGYVRGRVAA